MDGTQGRAGHSRVGHTTAGKSLEVGSVGRPLVPDYRPDRFGKSLICSQIEKNRIAGSRGGRHWQGIKRKRPAWKTTPAALRGILGANASTEGGPMLGMYFAEYRFTEYE